MKTCLVDESNIYYNNLRGMNLMADIISIDKYVESINRSLKDVADFEKDNIKKCGEIISNAVEADKRIHIFGTGGSSFIFALESFYRPGTLPQVNPFLEQGFMNSHGAIKARMLQQRVIGYGEAVLDYYRIDSGDVLIVVNPHGINKATIEAVMAGNKAEAIIIGISSKALCEAVPSSHPDRHRSGQSLNNLSELASHIDLHLSSQTVEGGLGGLLTPVLSFVSNSIVIATVIALRNRGIESSLWMDEYAAGGPDNNRRLEKKYRNKIRHL
jgi:uncharacterized phosphosugar-binding protein